MKHILVVDDEAVIRDLLVAFFRDVGYQADAKKTGNSALRWLSRNRTNMVLLDVLMPGMNGVDVLREIRRLHPALPVMIISGHADERVARQTLRMGAFDFFQKPFDLSILDSRVRTKMVLAEPEQDEVSNAEP
jgi:two-component system nitrogen regulation response regulator NtrX